MSAENKFYTTFHSKYRFSPSTTPLTLIGNSVNCKFLMQDCDVVLPERNSIFRCLFSKSIKYLKYPLIIKVQLNPGDDSITNDIIIALALNKYEPSNPHIMKFITAFMAPIAAVGKDHIYLTPVDIPSYSHGIKKPCAVFERIEYSIPLFELSKRPDFESKFAIPLGNLFSTCLDLGEKYGFAHHDLHSNNVLFDQEALVMIDYGRAYIDMKADDFNLANQLIRQAINDTNYYKGLISDIPNRCQDLRTSHGWMDLKSAFVMNDIGKLCCELLIRRVYMFHTDQSNHTDHAAVATYLYNLSKIYYNMLDELLTIAYDSQDEPAALRSMETFLDNTGPIKNDMFYRVISIGIFWVLSLKGTLNIDTRTFGCSKNTVDWDTFKNAMSSSWTFFSSLILKPWKYWWSKNPQSGGTEEDESMFHQFNNKIAQTVVDVETEERTFIKSEPDEQKFNNAQNQEQSMFSDICNMVGSNQRVFEQRLLDKLISIANKPSMNGTFSPKPQPSGITVGAQGGKATKPKPKKKQGASR